MSEMKNGARVSISGLHNAAHLNGSHGKDFNRGGPHAGRRSVRLEENGETVAIKPENLTIVSGGLRDKTAAAPSNAAWAKGLSQEDQYEWLWSN